jgi:signal transduction histidine kinase
MDLSARLRSATAATTEPAPPQPRPARVPPASSTMVPAGCEAAGEVQNLTDERDRVARRFNDIVVRRLFTAGLDLQAALGLVGDHPGADKIGHAIGELDQAITDLRAAIFDDAPETVVTGTDGSQG